MINNIWVHLVNEQIVPSLSNFARLVVVVLILYQTIVYLLLCIFVINPRKKTLDELFLILALYNIWKDTHRLYSQIS